MPPTLSHIQYVPIYEHWYVKIIEIVGNLLCSSYSWNFSFTLTELLFSEFHFSKFFKKNCVEEERFYLFSILYVLTFILIWLNLLWKSLIVRMVVSPYEGLSTKEICYWFILSPLHLMKYSYGCLRKCVQLLVKS